MMRNVLVLAICLFFILAANGRSDESVRIEPRIRLFKRTSELMRERDAVVHVVHAKNAVVAYFPDDASDKIEVSFCHDVVVI